MNQYKDAKYQDLISGKHLAETLKVSRPTVLYWMREKGLPFVKLGNDRYVLEQDFMEWFQSQRVFL